MHIDQVTWVRIGARMPPVDQRCRAVTTPSTMAAKASMTLPVRAVATAYRAVAVSYTHLDVYKRQGMTNGHDA